MSSYGQGRAFIVKEGRLLERRLAETAFDAAPAGGALAAVAAFVNPDGGIGHALEPDLRAPSSQPLFAEQALRAYDDIGVAPAEVLSPLCDHLAGVGQPAVPAIVPSALDHPHADHWTDDFGPKASLNPTAPICGLLHRFGASHPWLDEATGWCLDELRVGQIPTDAHTIRGVLTLLEHVPDSDDLVDSAATAMRTATWFRHDPDDPGYGLTPFHFAPSPAGRWRGLFGDALVERSLDRLHGDQQPDGGWPITWEPPSAAATLEWRGQATLHALRWLTAYGRLDPAGPDR